MKKSFFTICILATLCGIIPNAAIGQNSLNFDGINDRVSCGNDPSVQISGTQITLEAWVYPTAWKANVWEGSIISKEQNSPDFGYILRCGDGGKLSFNLGNGNWNPLISSAGALTLNTWQHVAGTYDGNKMRLYVNGVAIDSLTRSFSMSSPNQNLTIGNWSNTSSDRTFIGSIDEVRIWNIERSEEQVSADMNSQVCGTNPNLVAYYQLNDGIFNSNNTGVNITSDISGNGNNGFLTGFSLSGNTSNWVNGKILNPPSIVKETFTATDTAVCSGSSTTITTNSSDTNVTYTLKDAANGNTLDGPTIGTGSALSFNTGNLSSSTDYFVEGANRELLKKGFWGTALDFDGSNQYVDIGNVSALDFSNTDAFTIEAWVNSRNSSNPGHIFAKMFDANAYTGYAVMTNANGDVMLYLISDNPTQNFIYLQTNNSVLSGNTFHHVAVTYDGSSNANGVKIYVNGISVPFTANQNTLTGNIQTTAPANIGARTGVKNIDATVDEVRVWNYVRTNSEVSSNMNTRFLGSETGLLAYYTFEDGTGSSTVTDHTSNQNDGTIMNMNSSTDWVSGFGGSADICLDSSDTINVMVNNPTTETFIDAACGSYAWLGNTYTQSGTYVDTILNSVGCDSIVSLDLTINTVDLSIINFGDSLFANQADARYQWINCDNGNAILIGDTLQGFAPGDTGNYAVIITKNNCSDTSNCEPIIPSSIFENTTIENVSIYPNPSTDKVFIDFSETNFEGLISIYSIHGSLVNSRTITKERLIEIPLNYASGVYFIKIQKNNSQQIHIEKLIMK